MKLRGLALAFLACLQLLQAAPLRIVLPSQPAPPERFAADELVKYLVQMGNPKPEVVSAPAAGDIYLGGQPSGENPDGFVIRSEGDKLLLHGNSPRATLYAAYHYLESLGARWYFPGRENEVIPRANARLTGYDIKQVPSFAKRGIVIFSSTPGFRDLVDFAAKAKLNTIALHSDAGLADAERLFESRGLTLNLERHFFGENFCPDDQATLDREKKRFTDYVADLPSAMNEIFLWPADEFLKPCASPQFRDYSVPDLILSFANRMAQTLRESRPQAHFAYLSYFSTWQPPTREKPAEGVSLEWAPMFQSFGSAIDDPNSAVNAEYKNNFEELVGLFGGARTQVLGYWLDDTLFSRTHYVKLPHVPKALKGDLAYYHRLGVPAVTTFGVITGRDYFASHVSTAVFLYPKLLWNVQAETPALMHEFCRDYLRSESAMEIFDLLEKADSMVWVERHKLQTGRLRDPEFVRSVSRAAELAQKLMNQQQDPDIKARAARLVAEVASRFVSVPPE
jgi:hypothetical protein